MSLSPFIRLGLQNQRKKERNVVGDGPGGFRGLLGNGYAQGIGQIPDTRNLRQHL